MTLPSLPVIAPGKKHTHPRPTGSADALLLARFAQQQREAGRLAAVFTGMALSLHFRADRAGRFTIYCATQCSTEKLHPLMNGTFIVEDEHLALIVERLHAAIDADGRVLSALDGTPIPGLYAAGNAAASPFGLAYPGAGGTSLRDGKIADNHLDPGYLGYEGEDLKAVIDLGDPVEVLRACAIGCTGEAADLVASGTESVAGASLAEARTLFEVCTVMMNTIQSVPQPVIAKVHALATAAGMGFQAPVTELFEGLYAQAVQDGLDQGFSVAFQAEKPGAAVLVDERRAKHRELLDARRQRHRTDHIGTSALSRLNDRLGRLIDEAVVIRLEPNADPLLRHRYARIFVMEPAPTVRPPSRMAKRCPTSTAIGVISSTVISTLSPGMIISAPAGRPIEPVTSVVRR